MDKLRLFTILIMNAGFCFAQSDYVLTENNPNSKRRYNTFPVKMYDSINNKSTVSSFVKPLLAMVHQPQAAKKPMVHL